MEINGKIHLLFEQSGVFKRAFQSEGFEVIEYDIENGFGCVDVTCDIFREIECAINRFPSIFDRMNSNDLVMAFPPCIHFCTFASLIIKGLSNTFREYDPIRKAEYQGYKIHDMATHLLRLKQLEAIAEFKNLRLIIENTWHETMLSMWMKTPELVDYDRRRSGDDLKKPTAFWFYNCNPEGKSVYIKPKHLKTVNDLHRSRVQGKCSIERSVLSEEYAVNFVKCRILGQDLLNQLSMFND